jgi:hypothetical protein
VGSEADARIGVGVPSEEEEMENQLAKRSISAASATGGTGLVIVQLTDNSAISVVDITTLQLFALRQVTQVRPLVVIVSTPIKTNRQSLYLWFK